MRNSIRKLSSLLVLLVPALGWGADLDKGLAAYSEGDYETSLAECQPLAEEGNAVAQFCVGRLYANGFGVAMDDTLALQWYGAAAEQGHSEAQFSLGVMHANGWGVEMDEVAAAKWYRLAAEQAWVEAQTSLGRLCEKGRGVEQDLVEAYKWYDIASQLGDDGSSYKRDDVAEKLSAEQLATAQELTQRWMLAQSGDNIRVAGETD